MGLTKVSTDGVKDDAITAAKLTDTNAIDNTNQLQQGVVTTGKILDGSVTLAKLEDGTSSNDGKFLRANNGADPTFETVTGTTINNNADNRVITGSDTANNLEGESNVVINAGKLGIGLTSPAAPIHTHTGIATNYRAFSNTACGGSTGSDGFLLGIDSNANVNIWNFENTYMNFATNGTERMRILSSGGLTFNGDTAAANALNDYEEGTWSPSGSWTTITASYTKIGRMVYAGFSLRANTNDGSNVTIGNLPFTSGSTHGHVGGIVWGLCEFNTTDSWLNGSIGDAETTVTVRRGSATIVTFGSGNNNMNQNAFLRGMIVYMTD